MFRLGMAPSGASWSIEDPNVNSGGTHPRLDLDAYDLGLDAERRAYGNFWVALEAGWSGLRGLALVGGQYEAPAAHLNGTGYLMLSVKFRPASVPVR